MFVGSKVSFGRVHGSVHSWWKKLRIIEYFDQVSVHARHETELFFQLLHASGNVYSVCMVYLKLIDVFEIDVNNRRLLDIIVFHGFLCSHLSLLLAIHVSSLVSF